MITIAFSLAFTKEYYHDFLSIEQKQRLQHFLKEHEDAGVRERSVILLLMNDGKTHRALAAFFGCAFRPVAYGCGPGDPDHLDRLLDHWTLD